MTVKTITVSGEVKLSRDYQTASAGFEVVVALEEGENPKTVYKRVFDSFAELVAGEAREKLEAVLFGHGGGK